MQPDELWPGGPKLTQRDGVFKFGTDAVLLARFTNTIHAKRMADLGAGTGVLSILLAHRAPKMTVDSIDILEDAVALTRENAAQNGMEDRVTTHHGDIRDIRGMFPAGGFDLVVANPPYFPADSGRRATEESRVTAREETCCTLNDICAAAAYLLRWGGKFALVHRPERLAEICHTLSKHAVEPKRLQFVTKSAELPPSLILLEARRGGNPGLKIEPPLVTG